MDHGMADNARPGSEPVDLVAVCDRLDRALPFITVTTRASSATTRVRDVLDAAGSDPLQPWVSALHRMHERQAGAPVGVHVATAFVLQWWCQIGADVVAGAGALGPWRLDGLADGLGFELAPGLYPQTLVLDPGWVTAQGVSPTRRFDLAPDGDHAQGDQRERLESMWDSAAAQYRELVSPVVQHAAPQVAMSSRQRWGLVQDMWVAARRRAEGAAGLATGGPPPRASCCFIYVLPGAAECAGCPRLQGPQRDA